MNSRRDFLRAGALGAAAAAILPGLVRASDAPAAPSSSAPVVAKPAPLQVEVDWHSHWISPSELRLLSRRATAPRVFTDAAGKELFENVTTASFTARQPGPVVLSDLEHRARHLEANGVRRQLLSYTVAQGYDATLPIEEQRPFFRALNDDLAEAVRKYPKHYLGVAALPTGDPVWAAQELERAHRELGLIGGALPMNAFASLAGARSLAPIFAAGQRLGSHFFIHRAPANPVVPGQPPVILPDDTDSLRWSVLSNAHLTNGAITLGLTDFLDPYPDVSVQLIMLGGFFPYLLAGGYRDWSERLGADPIKRLRRVYFDPGPYSRNGKWVSLAVETIGADRILFGTDYGVGGGTRGDVAPAIQTLDSVLTPAQRQAIYVDNTRDLLARKGLA